MIQQLVQRLVSSGSYPTLQDAGAAVLESDPMDLVLHMEQVWDKANIWKEPTGPAGPARRMLWSFGQFAATPPSGVVPGWDHAGYAYVLENTRAVQIMRRVVRELRSGEGLGIPSRSTSHWLDTTEALLFGGANLFSGWLSTSTVRPDPEAVRRGLYWRLLGAELPFGTEDNKPYPFDRATAANKGFVPLFEELLFELWQAMSNERNISGPNQADNDRIFRIAEQLSYMLRVRRQQGMLAREELAAATALGWIDLTLSSNTPVVLDLRAEASSPGDRLRLIGERVGLAAHTRSASFFAMASELSLLLRTLEAGFVTGPGYAWLLYSAAVPPGMTPPVGGAVPLGNEARRVITEWAAATGKDLKKSAVAARVAQVPVPARA